PLTSIKGFAYSLARRLEKGEPSDPRSVQVLERQAERLHSLLEEMLEVSRIETGRFLLHQEPCEMLELVEASRRSLRRLGADGGAARRIASRRAGGLRAPPPAARVSAGKGRRRCGPRAGRRRRRAARAHDGGVPRRARLRGRLGRRRTLRDRQGEGQSARR